jgi:hypothetical protein
VEHGADHQAILAPLLNLPQEDERNQQREAEQARDQPELQVH